MAGDLIGDCVVSIWSLQLFCRQQERKRHKLKRMIQSPPLGALIWSCIEPCICRFWWCGSETVTWWPESNVADLSQIHFRKQAATDGTYRSKKHLFPGCGCVSGPNLQPCRSTKYVRQWIIKIWNTKLVNMKIQNNPQTFKACTPKEQLLYGCEMPWMPSDHHRLQPCTDRGAVRQLQRDASCQQWRGSKQPMTIRCEHIMQISQLEAQNTPILSCSLI